jgi:hypothetical protein
MGWSAPNSGGRQGFDGWHWKLAGRKKTKAGKRIEMKGVQQNGVQLEKIFEDEEVKQRKEARKLLHRNPNSRPMISGSHIRGRC